jgi:hypothetical protein
MQEMVMQFFSQLLVFCTKTPQIHFLDFAVSAVNPAMLLLKLLTQLVCYARLCENLIHHFVEMKCHEWMSGNTKRGKEIFSESKLRFWTSDPESGRSKSS